MPIKSNIKTHPVSWLVGQKKNGKLNDNISIQRKEVWDAERKSNLICSLLLDVPIESLLFEEAGGRNNYNVLDGKQRTLTLCSFVDDGFPLSTKIRTKEVDGTSLEGCVFSALPEDLQNRILDYQLSFSIMNPLETEDRATVFFMRNQAVALSKIDLLPVILGDSVMQKLTALCQHPFIRDKVKLTAPALRKRDDLKIILYYLIYKSGKDMGFSGQELHSFGDEVKHGDITIDVDEITALLDYLDEAMLKKWSYMKLTNVPVVMRVGQEAKEIGLAPEEFADKVNSFFVKTPFDEEYQETLQGGSAKKINVQQRLKVLMKVLDDKEESKQKR